MENWSQCTRIDLQHMDLAIAHNWTPEFDWRDKSNKRTTLDNCPHYPVSYRKENTVAWKCINDITHLSYIKVADLIDGRYCNHRDYPSLTETITNE